MIAWLAIVFLAAGLLLLFTLLVAEPLVDSLFWVIIRLTTLELTVRRPVKKADEYDLVTAWRHLLCGFRRAGMSAGIKRRLRRRYRHHDKAVLRTHPEEL